MKSTVFLAITAIVVLGCGKYPMMPDDPTQEPPSIAASYQLQASAALDAPEAFARAEADIKQMDPKALVPHTLLVEALLFFYANQGLVKNHSVIGIVDFSQHSSKARFYIVHTNGSGVQQVHVAHGKGSDPKNTGYATLFGNVPGSEKSSLGFYLTAKQIQHHGVAYTLEGLSPTNSNVMARSIWLHAATYVVESNVQIGRSWGCLAVSFAEQKLVMSSLGADALIYAGLSIGG